MKTLEYDICVLGAGPAGCAAAISARRNGAKVLLVDKAGVPGGMSTVGMLNIWCGDAYGSVFEYILEKTTKTVPSGRRIFSPEELKTTLINMLTDAGVELLLHSFVCGVKSENGRISEVSVQTKSGEIKISATTFIDCTGDGDVAALCGVPFDKGREDNGLMQPVTVEFMVGGVDESRALYANVGTPELKAKMQEYLADGRVSFPVGLLILIEALEPHTAYVNMTNVIGVDPTNVFDMTRAELEARRQIPQIVRFLKENVPGYENCCALTSSAYAGVRESRRIRGTHTITVDEIKEAIRFEDWIVDGAMYHFGVHSTAGTVKRPEDQPKSENKRYTIPYGCFTPEGMKNLLVAGRCISGDHYACSSYRVMPICFAMGEGVGTCAAYAFANGIDAAGLTTEQIKEVQALIKAGVMG